jgi:hypothetical protein
VSQGLTLPLLTLEQSSVQLDQDTVKLPSYFAYITLLLFSVCLVRQHTDDNSGSPYSGDVLLLGRRHVQGKKRVPLNTAVNAIYEVIHWPVP